MKLKSIRLNNTNHNSKIDRGETYLVKIYGEIFAGQFSKQWYGWNFNNWGCSRIQLDAIEKVWRIIK